MGLITNAFYDRRFRGTPRTGVGAKQKWIPACAGMTFMIWRSGEAIVSGAQSAAYLGSCL